MGLLRGFRKGSRFSSVSSAHMKAIDYLRAGNDSLVCNLGNGQGFSVLEILKAARRVTGH